MAKAKNKEQPALRKLRVLYDEVGANRRRWEATSTHKVSCGPDCYGCCYQIVAISFPEAILMARAARAKSPKWLEALHARIARDALELVSRVSDSGMSRDDWFREARPCPFLEGSKCSVYSARPSACRTYAVVSPKEHCYPGYTGKVLVVSSAEADRHLVKANYELSAEMGLPYIYGPLPTMMQLAFDYCDHGVERTMEMHAHRKEITDWLSFWRALEGADEGA